MKNIDKWNYYKEALNKRDQDFIKSVVGEKLPETFYTVEPAFNTGDYYRVREKIVEAARYQHVTHVMFWWDGKKSPTNIAIGNLKTYVDSEISYYVGRINLFWIYGNTSGATSWTDFVEKKDIYHNLAEAEAAAETKRRQYIEEKGQLDAGTHVKCMYCGAVRLSAEIHYAQICSPNWKTTGGKSPPRPYCKDKGCAGYDQMGHEG